jgi:hypothetical protein
VKRKVVGEIRIVVLETPNLPRRWMLAREEKKIDILVSKVNVSEQITLESLEAVLSSMSV